MNSEYDGLSRTVLLDDDQDHENDDDPDPDVLEQVVQVPLLVAAASRERLPARPRAENPVKHVPPTWGGERQILACRGVAFARCCDTARRALPPQRSAIGGRQRRRRRRRAPGTPCRRRKPRGCGRATPWACARRSCRNAAAPT